MINVQLNSFEPRNNLKMVFSAHAITINIAAANKYRIKMRNNEKKYTHTHRLSTLAFYVFSHSVLLFIHSSSLFETLFPFHQINNIPGYCSKTYRFFGVSHSPFFFFFFIRVSFSCSNPSIDRNPSILYHLKSERYISLLTFTCSDFSANKVLSCRSLYAKQSNLFHSSVWSNFSTSFISNANTMDI